LECRRPLPLLLSYPGDYEGCVRKVRIIDPRSVAVRDLRSESGTHLFPNTPKVARARPKAKALKCPSSVDPVHRFSIL